MSDDRDLLSESLNHTWAPVVDPSVGSIYILSVIALLVPYFICIYIMYTDETLKSSSFFRIAIHIGVTDVLQIFFNSIVGGLLTLTNYQAFWINNTSAAIVGFGWTTCLAVAHLMAFNRFVYIYWPDKVKYFFSPGATTLALAACWLSGLLWLAVLMNPNVNLVYDLNRYSYIYIRTEWTKYVIIIHMGYNIAHVIGMIIWYGFIFSKIRTQLRSMMNRSVSKDSRRDVKILAQAVFLCALVIATTITFTIDQYVITHWSISFMTNILWLVCAGSNSFVHIAINRFVYIYWPNKVKHFFSPKATSCALVGCWLLGVVWFIVLMNPNINLIYDLNKYSFIYIHTNLTEYIIVVHMGYNMVHVIGMTIWYTLIFTKIRTQLRSMINRSVSRDSRRDVKILAQAVFLCALATATTVTFTINQYFPTHSSVSFLTNIIWLVCAGSNSLVHISINSGTFIVDLYGISKTYVRSA